MRVLVCPWRQDARIEDLEEVFFKRLRARPSPRASLANAESTGTAYEIADGRVLDVLYARLVGGNVL
jgi:hypothetical protein